VTSPVVTDRSKHVDEDAPRWAGDGLMRYVGGNDIGVAHAELAMFAANFEVARTLQDEAHLLVRMLMPRRDCTGIKLRDRKRHLPSLAYTGEDTLPDRQRPDIR
jgi:hypothetical protein